MKPNMYVSRMDAVFNAWFTSYEEARASLEAGGGYLLPYKGQFFVTQSEGIRELGLDPNDPDWELIGWNWVRPKDSEAWKRLRGKTRRGCGQELMTRPESGVGGTLERTNIGLP